MDYPMSNTTERRQSVKQDSAAVKWVYTKWEDKDLFPVADCEYRVEGIETCPDTGKKHWQVRC